MAFVADPKLSLVLAALALGRSTDRTFRPPPDDLARLVAGLERAVVSREGMLSYLQIVQGLGGTAPTTVRDLSPDELEDILKSGLAGLAADILCDLALTAPALMGLRSVVVAELPPYWLGVLRDIIAERDVRRIAGTGNALATPPPTWLDPAFFPAALSGYKTDASSRPPEAWSVTIPAWAVQGPLPDGGTELTVEFIRIWTGPHPQLEVRLDALLLTKDARCRGMLRGPGGVVVDGFIRDQRLNFELAGLEYEGSLLDCEYERHGQRISFRCLVRPGR
ncbi:MAG TPA: hypothetical protein VHR66_31705 [Gemmataceae bacterium]|jgi:hypothetical protein|nr:hypothetical protein [Gemmataceae bacterium]